METKDEIIASISDVAGRLATRFTEEDVDEQAYMRNLCSPPAQSALDRMTIDGLHLLEAIAVGEDPAAASTVQSTNVVGLARATGVPKGTVSKRLCRLEDLGLVTRHRIPGNRKEVHLRLTPLGTEVRQAHLDLHEQMGDALNGFFMRYSAAELAVFERILSDMLMMPREGLRFRPDLIGERSKRSAKETNSPAPNLENRS